MWKKQLPAKTSFLVGVFLVCVRAAPTKDSIPVPVFSRRLSLNSDKVDIFQAEESQASRLGLDVNSGKNQDGSFREERRQSDGGTLGTYGYYDDNGELVLRHYVKDKFGYRVLSEYRPYEPLVKAQPTNKPTQESSVDDEFEEEEDPPTPLPPLDDKEFAKNLNIKKDDKGSFESNKTKFGHEVSPYGPLHLLFNNKVDPLYTLATENNKTETSTNTKNLTFPSPVFSFHTESNNSFNTPPFLHPPRFFFQENFANEPYDPEFYDPYEDKNVPTFEHGHNRLYTHGRKPYRYSPYAYHHNPFFEYPYSFHPRRPLHFEAQVLDYGSPNIVNPVHKNKIKGVRLVKGQIVLINDDSPVQADQGESHPKSKEESSVNQTNTELSKIIPLSPLSSQTRTNNPTDTSKQGKKQALKNKQEFVLPNFDSPEYFEPFRRSIRPFGFDNFRYNRPSFGFDSFRRPTYLARSRYENINK
ncbi:uncharacterized protein LOC111085113 [Limulus polyphemus]|uniref:Uncharacterized protein LOC111085113 n=1 Tax=Limulus polyphemus TaxID=6850 RepID=A0ABM1S334_LIMPO|nr:uncharacterized protein LOC111085113 [Limulus polyphemus]